MIKPLPPARLLITAVRTAQNSHDVSSTATPGSLDRSSRLQSADPTADLRRQLEPADDAQGRLPGGVDSPLQPQLSLCGYSSQVAVADSPGRVRAPLLLAADRLD